MVNSRTRMENDQLQLFSTSIKPHFHDESKGESTWLPGSPRIQNRDWFRVKQKIAVLKS